MTLTVKTRTVKEIAELAHARVVGDETVQLTGISSVQSARPGDLVFVDNEKNLHAALESRASALVVGRFAEGEAGSKPLLFASQPRLAFARAAQVLHPKVERHPGIHPSAI